MLAFFRFRRGRIRCGTQTFPLRFSDRPGTLSTDNLLSSVRGTEAVADMLWTPDTRTLFRDLCECSLSVGRCRTELPRKLLTCTPPRGTNAGVAMVLCREIMRSLWVKEGCGLAYIQCLRLLRNGERDEQTVKYPHLQRIVARDADLAHFEIAWTASSAWAPGLLSVWFCEKTKNLKNHIAQELLSKSRRMIGGGEVKLLRYL